LQQQQYYMPRPIYTPNNPVRKPVSLTQQAPTASILSGGQGEASFGFLNDKKDSFEFIQDEIQAQKKNKNTTKVT